MGKVVQVKGDYYGVLLPPSGLPFSSGQSTTLTDAEYAALDSATLRALSVTASGVTDPVRTSGSTLASLTVSGPSSLGGTLAVSGAATLTSTLVQGNAPQNAYPVELGQTTDAIVSDLSYVRIRARASRGTTSPSSFFGHTAVRVEIEDTANVVDGTTAPYLYGLRVRMSPKYGRNQSGIDDAVGVAVLNRSFTDSGTAFNGTEAVYVGWGGGSTGGASKDWNTGVGIDTVADNGMYIVRGPYAYGILMTASFSTAAMRIPNNSLVVARNAAGSANVNVIKLDTSDNVRVGPGSIRTVVGSPNADSSATQTFEVHSSGFTDGTLGKSHSRFVDTTAFASGVGAAIGFAGYSDATPTIRTFGGITGRKANATSGNTAGYLALFSRHATNGLTETLRLTELQKVQLADAADVIVGTTTGSIIGTAAAQKLGFWGATAVVQPTTAVAAATFVAGTGTAVQDTSTFDGYTIKQVVKALRTIGVLA